MVYCEKQWCKQVPCSVKGRAELALGGEKKDKGLGRVKDGICHYRTLLCPFLFPFSFIYLWVWMCVCKLATCMHACMYICVSTCVWKPEVEPGHFPSIFSALLSEDRVSHWTWISLIQIDCLAINTQGFSCFCLPSTGIKAAHHWILVAPSHELGYWRE